MRRLEVRYQDSASEDLQDIYLHLVSRGVSVSSARAYVMRIRTSCNRIGDAPEGGRQISGLAPGLRSWAFERRAVYRIEGDVVIVENVFYGGRDIDAIYAQQSRRNDDTS